MDNLTFCLHETDFDHQGNIQEQEGDIADFSLNGTIGWQEKGQERGHSWLQSQSEVLSGKGKARNRGGGHADFSQNQIDHGLEGESREKEARNC